MSSIYLKVTTQTWDQEAHGLFDYNSNRVQQSSFKVQKSSSILLSTNKCYVPDPEILPFSVPLLRLTRNLEAFQISSHSEEEESDLWLVVRYTKHRTTNYQLQEGDWLKLGKIKFLVKQINTQSSDLSENLIRANSDQKVSENREDLQREPKVCRICLCDIWNEENPLISPCSCSGTMSKVHIGCLKHWLQSKTTARATDKLMTLYAKDLKCELCKQDIPELVVYNTKLFSLVDFYTPKNSCFIILEEYCIDRVGKQGVHIIRLAEGQAVVIGRNPECDLKVNDITVSRKHCSVILNKDGFCLQDRESKFGTLVKMKNTFKVMIGEDFSMQVDRCLVRIEVKEKCNVCCYDRKSKVASHPSITVADGGESISESAAFINRQME